MFKRKDKDQSNPDRKDDHLATGIGVGIALGVAIGAALDNIAIGIALGIAIGAGIGSSLGTRRTSDFFYVVVLKRKSKQRADVGSVETRSTDMPT